ncbi:MAG: CRISPR system precrRNA processing endoribonuclease RAMP protein Cas6, partial [Candidatus Hydrogenedentes bacterium]|nr:CRISPR system precrRNA processing endoribonuclease RAMP protein Cas6 [Candidatus Hydrogenedentota bacterium]
QRNGGPPVREGERAELTITLVGNAYFYVPHVFLALQELGSAGLGRDNVRFQIEEVSAENGQCVYDASASTVLHPVRPRDLALEPGPSRTRRFTLEFLSPLRLQHEGSICAAPGLPEIVTALRRRVFLLRYFHGGGLTDQLSTHFLDAARDAVTLENTFAWEAASRTSTRQRQNIPTGGVRGMIACEGDFGVLEPLLRAGEYVHVGKNATFGLGQYRLLLGDEA